MFPREKKNKKIQITSSELSYVFIWINVSYRIGDVNKRDCPPTTSTIPMPQLSPHPLGLAYFCTSRPAITLSCATQGTKWATET